MDGRWERIGILAAGLLMTLVGGILKAADVLSEPEVIEFMFFSGRDYLLLFSGACLLVIAAGYNLLFDGD